MTQRKSLHINDLVTGVLASLALRDIRTLSRRQNRLDKAFERLYEDYVLPLASENQLEVRFRIKTDRVHHYSLSLRHALKKAAQRHLVSFDNPEFQDIRLKIRKEEADQYLANLPGRPEMYQQLARRLLEFYRNT